MLWFNFIFGSYFIFLCFKLIIIHYHTQKPRKQKFEPRIKLNYNVCTTVILISAHPLVVLMNANLTPTAVSTNLAMALE